MVYPPGVKGTDRLTFLAGLFRRGGDQRHLLPAHAPDYARRWLEAVADHPDFRFTAKVWQVFTHERRLPEAELAQFQEGLEPFWPGANWGCSWPSSPIPSIIPKTTAAIS